MLKKITVNIDAEALKIIDEAAEKDCRGNRSQFLEIAGIEKAKKIGVDHGC